jgi:SAM-dependent methyltransferase
MSKSVQLRHPNDKPYNFLIYKINLEFIDRFKKFYKGNLYDLGCGEMPYREWFLQYASTYTGVDWEKSLHNIGANIVADLNEPLPIEDGAADTVISLSVLEHLREPAMFLQETHRILKPGGVLVLQVPFMWWEHEVPHDYYRFTRYGLSYLLRKAGFATVEVHAQTGFWLMWILKFNYQTTRLIRGPRISRRVVTAMLEPIWLLAQHLARWLDRRWATEGETAAYFAVATKSVAKS